MDLLSISLLGGGLVLIWAAMTNKNPLEAIKLLTGGKNPAQAKPIAGEAGDGAEPLGTAPAPGTGGSDPPII
jgi:hypothetical protein